MFLESLFIGALIFFLFYMISLKSLNELEGVSSYECGFDLSSSTRVPFSYRFFLISILFLIFDVEMALMLPIPFFLVGGFLSLLFLAILVVGLLFEYFLGVLKWL